MVSLRSWVWGTVGPTSRGLGPLFQVLLDLATGLQMTESYLSGAWCQEGTQGHQQVTNTGVRAPQSLRGLVAAAKDSRKIILSHMCDPRVPRGGETGTGANLVEVCCLLWLLVRIREQ